MATSGAVTCLKRMRLPLLAATIAMALILLLDVFVFDPTARSAREAEEEKEVTLMEQVKAETEEKKKEEKTLLFDEALWDNIAETDDWDAIFDNAAWSSLLNEGFVGANVKDEPPLPRFKKPAGGAAPIPKDGSMNKAAVVIKAPEVKVVLSLGLAGQVGTPADVVVTGKSKKAKKKAKKDKAAAAALNVPPETFDKYPAPTDEKKVYSWFDESYKKSQAYGKASAFVEDEPLFGSCGTSLVAARSWGETFVALNPFRYLGRSKNPCWYPDQGGKFTCIPYFHLAGVAGPGTDDVMQKLLIHPHIVGKKEQTHWWDIGRHAGKSWESYCAEYQKETDDILIDINDKKASEKIYGDSTSTYFAAPTGWERLSGNENCDEPRIILGSHLRRLRVLGLIMVVMPHPTRRLLAEARQGGKVKLNPAQFHTDVEQAINTYKACFTKYSMRQCAYNKTLADSVKLSLHEGMYSIYMEDWVRIFPPEQFLVLRFEDYVSNIVPTLGKMFDFLSIPQIEPTELAIAADVKTPEFRELVKSHNPGTALPATITLLNDFYAPFLTRLGEIMKDPVRFTWKDT